MRAVFMDRDGVLNRVVPRDAVVGSPRSLAELELLPGATDAVARLRGAGFLTFIVTNQPDLARGSLSQTAHAAIMAAVGAAIEPDDVAVCPHDDGDACACRKPRPGMLTELASRWGVTLRESYIIGDGWKDVAAGRAAGCRTILVRTAYNREVAADAGVEDLLGAVDLIVGARPGAGSQ